MALAVTLDDKMRPNCRTCNLDSPEARHLRVHWGCDERAPAPVFEMPCTGCVGSGCESCDWTGTRQMFDCPHKMLRSSGRDVLAVATARGMLEHGVLPVAGGWTDQSATMMHALRIVKGAESYYEERRRPADATGD